MKDIWRPGTAPAKVVWLRMLKVVRQLGRASAVPVERAGLSMAQFVALARVGEAPGRSQGELAEWLGVTEGNASQVVGRLEAAGLVERRADRRAYRLFVTDGGRQKLRELMPDHDAAIAEHFSVLTRAEQRQLASLLRKLYRAQEAP